MNTNKLLIGALLGGVAYFLLGWLLYNEDVSATKLVGFGLIWVCLALVVSDSVVSRQRN